MTTNTTSDSSLDLRRTRLILLSTLFSIGLTGCSLVLIWLIRYTRGNMRSARICSLILNLIIANFSVYIFATGIQIYWELQTNRQWPFNDLLCRIAKFFQSFSILSSTYIVVAMAIDRCIAIVTPLKAGKIRVLYLCGCAWALAGLLSTPNFILFHLHVNGSVRYCTPVFSHSPSLAGRRIYLTFISLVVYFIPSFVLILCYTLIFIKLLCREHDQRDWTTDRSSSIESTEAACCCPWFCNKKMPVLSNIMHYKTERSSSANLSSFNDHGILQKRVNTYAKARSKTFRMIIVLVLFTILFGAPYYCLELYIAYTGRHPSRLILALAGGAAVAPSSLDPWVFLLFWVNWGESNDVNSSRRFVAASLQQQHYGIQSRRVNRSNTLGTSSISYQCPHQQQVPLSNTTLLLPVSINCNTSVKKLRR